jgi:hypothetical protein
MLKFLRYVMVFHPIYFAIPITIACKLSAKAQPSLTAISTVILVVSWAWVLRPGLLTKYSEHYLRLNTHAPENPTQKRVRTWGGMAILAMLVAGVALYLRGQDEAVLILIAIGLIISFIILRQEFDRYRGVVGEGSRTDA